MKFHASMSFKVFFPKMTALSTTYVGVEHHSKIDVSILSTRSQFLNFQFC